MDSAELRNELHNYIDKADDTFLRMVHAMSKEYHINPVVGYNIDGSEITRKDLIKRVKQASARVKNGEYISHEDLEKEVKNW
jgi:hypothetical protein